MAMRWRRPYEDFPEGACACGLDLAGAADLGVFRSYQQEDVPEPQPSRRQPVDLTVWRCQAGVLRFCPSSSRAEGTTRDRQFSFAEVLAWASLDEPVYPGEFFAVGTVGGGCGLELDRWIQPDDVVELPDDVVELEASGVGVLRNPVGPRQVAPPGASLPSYTGAPRVGDRH